MKKVTLRYKLISPMGRPVEEKEVSRTFFRESRLMEWVVANANRRGAQFMYMEIGGIWFSRSQIGLAMDELTVLSRHLTNEK